MSLILQENSYLYFVDDCSCISFNKFLNRNLAGTTFVFLFFFMEQVYKESQKFNSFMTEVVII